ncbi:MAG TPA: hypothetical protein VF624_11545 [Tepidisphaeraceae bacterium]|jgi:uncharacterized membrane protein
MPRRAALFLTAAVFSAAGVAHFVYPDTYARLIPPGFLRPRALVAVSGAAELLGGIGLLFPRLRRAAGYGLIGLLIAVFPANIYMAVRSERFTPSAFWTVLYWLRLPLQPLMILWIWRLAIDPASTIRTSKNASGGG